MGAGHTKRQNFDVTPEQETEIAWLREALGASTGKDAVLRAIRIAAVLSREVKDGRSLLLRTAEGRIERLIIPELERPATTGWRYLVEREHPWRLQMSIKGKRLLAATIWGDMIASGQTPDEAAEEWGIPRGAVEEAVRWCEANRAVLEMDAEEERRRLVSAGVPVAPPR